MRIGYHASHEQFSPADLLDLAQAARSRGFGGMLSSDHFQPWTHAQGHSGFSWCWLGAAMALTDVPYGVVCAPGYRYHPAVLAQAAATLAVMFPGRFWMAAGSGQWLNESVLGGRWPSKEERNRRLEECVRVMRHLWAGETVTHRGSVTVESARLYDLPDPQPPIFGAALTPETARWVGSWADGMITVSTPGDRQRRMIDAFREGGGGRRPVYLKVQVSYARDRDEALAGAYDQWRANTFDSPIQSRLAGPDEFEQAAAHVRPEDLFDHVRISADTEEHAEWLRSDFDMGVDRVYLHNVNRDQRRFIDDFGSKVLPQLEQG